MSQSPRERRLQSDYDKVQTLVNESGGTLALIRTAGNPPTTYVIEYHCPSLVKDTGGKITIQHRHQVEIKLGANYPLEKPSARMVTPVFNPHVFSSNAICLGVVWSAAETLDVLILRIGALLQLDPKVLDPHSPANHEAQEWVRKNKDKIPLGNITFKVGKKPPSKIVWF